MDVDVIVIKMEIPDIKADTEIRAHEASDSAALKKELTEVIDTLNRTIGLLERYACMLELENANNLLNLSLIHI